MKRFVKSFTRLFLVFFVSNFSVFGQNEEQRDQVLINVIENPPVFEGGMNNFYTVVSKNLRSVDDKIGRVFVHFLIDTTGKMTGFKIVRGLSEKSDNEVLRLMKWMSENYSWKPSKDTRTRKSRITIPIVFKKENTINYVSNKKEIKENQIYTIAENPPIFEGGQDNFYKIINKNLKFAEKSNVTGSRVFIEFVIDTTGKMTDFKILKSNFSKKNNEGFLQLLDSINSTYTWKPAMHKGKKVFYRMSLPIIICRLD